MTSPTVSVCIPSYNSAAYIGRTIASVLSQTFEDFELVVVDDASTDGTADAVCGFTDSRLRVVVNEKNLGAVANWNKALALTTGEFVKLVCGDDLLYPQNLERQVAALRAAPAASMAASKRDIVDAHDRVVARARGLGRMSALVDGNDAIRHAVRSGSNPFGEPFCVLMRRSAIEQCGQFRDMHYVIDLDYWTRLLQVGPLVSVRETLGAFRVVQTSWSRRIGKAQSRQTIALFEHLHEELPFVVSATDVRIGSVAAHAKNAARLALYRLMRL